MTRLVHRVHMAYRPPVWLYVVTVVGLLTVAAMRCPAYGALVNRADTKTGAK